MKRKRESKELSPSNPPHSLAQIQRAFGTAIMNPLDSRLKSRKLMNDGNAMIAVAKEYLTPNDRLTQMERLEIYNTQYWYRIIDCLCHDFPILRAVLGTERFLKLISAYMTRYPSRTFTVRNLGVHMVDFLSEYPQYAGPKRARLALEIARFEWAKVAAYDLAGWKPLDHSSLAATTTEPQDLVFHLQPYLFLFELSYPWDEILAENAEGTKARASEASTERAPEIDSRKCKLPRPQKTYIAVHRYQNCVYTKRLERLEFIILSQLKKGLKLGDAIEEAFKHARGKDKSSERAAELIFEWFSLWKSLDWFAIPS